MRKRERNNRRICPIRLTRCIGDLCELWLESQVEGDSCVFLAISRNLKNINLKLRDIKSCLENLKRRVEGGAEEKGRVRLRRNGYPETSREEP